MSRIPDERNRVFIINAVFNTQTASLAFPNLACDSLTLIARRPFGIIIVRFAYIIPESQLARRSDAFIKRNLKPEYWRDSFGDLSGKLVNARLSA